MNVEKTVYVFLLLVSILLLVPITVHAQNYEKFDFEREQTFQITENTNICLLDKSDKYLQITKQSIEDWTIKFKQIGNINWKYNLTLEQVVKPSCDVTISFMDKPSSDNDYGLYGLNRFELGKLNIQVFTTRYSADGTELDSDDLKRILKHELGHMFGLRHEFGNSFTKGEHQNPSIMTFNFNDSEITYQDAINAINAMKASYLEKETNYTMVKDIHTSNINTSKTVDVNIVLDKTTDLHDVTITMNDVELSFIVKSSLQVVDNSDSVDNINSVLYLKKNVNVITISFDVIKQVQLSNMNIMLANSSGFATTFHVDGNNSDVVIKWMNS